MRVVDRFTVDRRQSHQMDSRQAAPMTTARSRYPPAANGRKASVNRLNALTSAATAAGAPGPLR